MIVWASVENMKEDTTKEEVAWVAGILEGEGCFDYQQPLRKRCPQVRVEMVDKDIVMRVQGITGGTICLFKGKQPNHNDSWCLGIRRKELVIPLLNKILPYMSMRRTAKIKELLSYFER